MTQNLKPSFTLLFLWLAILLSSCQDCKDTADLSDIDYELQIGRYEKSLFNLKSEDLRDAEQILNQQFPGYTRFFFQDLMGYARLWDDSLGLIPAKLNDFLHNPYNNELMDSIEAQYGAFSVIESELETALKHVIYYFPDRQLPEVITSTTGLAFAAFTVDTSLTTTHKPYLVLGLDLHLGENFRGYKMHFPQYAIQKFKAEYLVPNALKALYTDWFDQQDEMQERKDLIYEMIEAGKKIYFCEKMMPCEDPYRILGYTPDQLLWCKTFEHKIWEFFIEQQLLYEDDFMDYRRFLEDGPSTTGLPKESPGNIGAFVGWRIIQKFMSESQSEISLKQLLELDPKKIMLKSRYKPTESTFQ